VDDVDLTGVQGKLRRAEAHLRTLHEAVVAYLGPALEMVSYPCVEPVGVSFYALVNEPPPVDLGVILGDFVHNLRSALDHLMWQVVIMRGATPGRWTQYPIYDTPAEFERRVTRPAAEGKKSPMLGCPPWVVAWIETGQPYQQPEEGKVHTLAILRDFSNTDKHQVLHAAVAAVQLEMPTVHHATVQGHLDVLAGPIRDGAPIARLHCTPPRTAVSDEEFRVTMNADVRFGGVDLTTAKLNELLGAVAEVIVAIVGFMGANRASLPGSSTN
jgi:hypothetical protein